MLITSHSITIDRFSSFMIILIVIYALMWYDNEHIYKNTISINGSTGLIKWIFSQGSTQS